MKPKKEGTTTPKKQTTLDPFVTLTDKKRVAIDPDDLERETYEWNGVWYNCSGYCGSGSIGQFDSDGARIEDNVGATQSWGKEEADGAWYDAFPSKVNTLMKTKTNIETYDYLASVGVNALQSTDNNNVQQDQKQQNGVSTTNATGTYIEIDENGGFTVQVVQV